MLYPNLQKKLAKKVIREKNPEKSIFFCLFRRDFFPEYSIPMGFLSLVGLIACKACMSRYSRAICKLVLQVEGRKFESRRGQKFLTISISRDEMQCASSADVCKAGHKCTWG